MNNRCLMIGFTLLDVSLSLVTGCRQVGVEKAAPRAVGGVLDLRGWKPGSVPGNLVRPPDGGIDFAIKESPGWTFPGIWNMDIYIWHKNYTLTYTFAVLR